MYWTTLSKKYHCPVLDLDIYLTGKYYFCDTPENPFRIIFSSATCPIIENMQKKAYDQDEEFKYLICRSSGQCVGLNSFPAVADSRKCL